jgi:ATP-binding cassette subfamily B protein
VLELESLCWDVSRLPAALSALATGSGLSRAGTDPSAPPEHLERNFSKLEQWLHGAARWYGFELDPEAVSYSSAETLLGSQVPALFWVPGEPRFICSLGRAGRGKVRIIGPDLRPVKVPIRELRAKLFADSTAPTRRALLRAFDAAGLSPRSRERSLERILGEYQAPGRSAFAWCLRPPPSRSFRELASRAGVWRYLALHVVATLLFYPVELGIFWMAARWGLGGRFDPGWFAGWVVLLFTLIPLQLALVWSQGVFATGAAAVLKRKLLYGAMRLPTDSIKGEGVGLLLGRVLESDAIESLPLRGGLGALTGTLELLYAAAVLALAPGGLACAALLLGWWSAVGLLAWRYARLRDLWAAGGPGPRPAESRLSLTRALVEAMGGHRTRLIQERREHRHESEDQQLASYLAQSRAMDRAAVWLTSAAPQLWCVAALLLYAPVFAGGISDASSVALVLGAVLMAAASFGAFSQGMTAIIDAWVAWKQVRPFFEAATEDKEVVPDPDLALADPGAGPVVEAHSLSFAHAGRFEPVLRGASVKIERGERLLLEGESGSGKSTFVQLISGLRTPRAGLVLVNGLDRATLGADGWRRRVALAPQFHENHVLTGTFAFNLLMGRRWPAKNEDLEEAEKICRELGLGPLLERMPSGFFQMVGETGWQLSHGERSRLYLARALLQGADLVILDETFGALDPSSHAQAVACAAARAPSLMVIAHP